MSLYLGTTLIAGNQGAPDTPSLTSDNTFTGINTFSASYGIRTKTPVILKENDNTGEGGQIEFESGDTEPNAGKQQALDRYNGTFRFWGADSNNNVKIPFVTDIQNDKIVLSHNALNNLVALDNSRAIGITGQASGSSYTAQVTGWVCVVADTGGNRTATLDCYNASTGFGLTEHVGEFADQYHTMRTMIKVSAGDSYVVIYSNCNLTYIQEIPLKGWS